LTAKFRKRYAQAKRDRNLVDFSDMEHFCIEILLSPDEKQPTAAALELAASFEEVLIDEYQDSNSVQEMILWAIARQTPGNRFMVGDVKQSIYKFRRANPRIFMGKYENFYQATGAEMIDSGVTGRRIDLSKNFRSRASVLDAVNFFFSQLMTKEIGELCYDAAAALYPGARYPSPFASFASYATEIHLVDYQPSDPESDTGTASDLEELTKAAAEAQAIGERIKEFVRGENPLLITDPSTGAPRPCQYGDIVILLRSLGETAQTLTEEFKKLEISSYADTNTAFFETIEIMTALSFLQVIDNPRQDIHLIAALHSPIYALSPDDLLAIRQMDKAKSFYECLFNYENNYENSDERDAALLAKIAAFQADLRKWRALAVYTPISELLSLVYDDTGYYALAGAMPGGLTRQANLRSLLEKAEQYETTTFKGLFHFIRYMDRLQKSDLEPRFGDARQFEQQDDRNAVRIMTIHKSKGLEFPVVFVGMLGRKFNQMDEHENVLLHEEFGLGSFYVDTNRRTKVNTLPRFCLAKKIRLESLSEELRVLYVAMTRAKEKLVLTGCVDKLNGKIQKWNQFADWGEIALPLYYRAACQNFLDFIMPCVVRHRDGIDLRATETCSNHACQELFQAPAAFEIHIQNLRAMSNAQLKNNFAVRDRLDALRQIAPGQSKSGRQDEIRSIIWHRYPFETEHFPSKISISEIKRLFYQESLSDSATLDSVRTDFPPPVFLQKDQKSLSTRRGTAIHTVMEHLDLTRDRTETQINILLETLTARGLLLADDRALVPTQKIINFANSDLAERMRRSSSVRREVPFVLGLQPDEIYPAPVAKTSEIILVHGIIDCYFVEGDGLVLLDYKSDSVRSNDVTNILERYRVQMRIYQKALERSTHLPVRETLLYLFAIEAAIDINCEKDYNCEKIN
jgi:ATP-dependent helicase/nuclease subunit A